MTQLLNGHPDSLTNLVGRVTDPQDRERYAELISHFRSLLPGDELLKLAELLGLLSVISVFPSGVTDEGDAIEVEPIHFSFLN